MEENAADMTVDLELGCASEVALSIPIIKCKQGWMQTIPQKLISEYRARAAV